MSQLDVIEFTRKDRGDVDFGIISGKVIMRVLETHEIEAVAGGEQGMTLYWRTYDSFWEVWGGGNDRLSTYWQNQAYLAAAQVAQQNGETLSRADFFGY